MNATPTPKRTWTLIAAAVLAAAPAAWADPSNSSYRLVFADEFNGTALDTSKWAAASPGWTMPNSDSTASASMVDVSNGVLTLAAIRNGTSDAFTSGSISSYQKYTLTSGYIEARIDLPSTPGSWPAFWGLYTGWPPEIDIMEYPLTTGNGGYANNQYHTAYHYTNSNGDAAAGAGQVTTGTNLGATGYHTFAMDWTAGSGVVFYLDGNRVHSYSGSSMSQMVYMYMILDYAIGGWPGTPSLTQWPAGFTDQVKVDYVRVWQTNPNGDAPTTWNVNGGGAFSTATNWSAGVPVYGNQIAVFGRVGTASSANISMSASQVFGGIVFDGLASGSLAGTTAYTLGTSSAYRIQLSTRSGSGALVQATSASTASQRINASVEAWSNTTIRNDMTGGQTLTLAGGVTGNGRVTIEGPGTVVFSSVGSYTGGTVINGGGPGPAVLRAGAKSALGIGSVVIGSSGNATTARLEIINSSTLPNNIDFRGRNNTSVGIQNISGNNVISGTVSTGVGGSSYLIQSDAGSLSLTGAAAGATARGVALQSLSSGSRMVTLQGAGDGAISGIIRDGSGSLGITKAGAGVWTLSGANTYTGPTIVNEGTLRLISPTAVSMATPVLSYSFSHISGTTVLNDGSGGSSMNGTLNPNGGSGSINVTGGPAAGMGALVLNGTGTTVDINTGVASLSSNAAWTVSAWVKTSQPGFTILHKGDGTNWNSGFSTFYLGKGSSAGIGSVPDAVRWGGGWLGGSTSIDDDTWHLVTYTNAAGAKAIYVDGVPEVLTQSQFNNTDTGSMIRLGFSPVGEADGNLMPTGSLSGINIYNTALSAAQVAALYTGTFAGSGSPLPSASNVTVAAGAALDASALSTLTLNAAQSLDSRGVILGNLTLHGTASLAGSVSGALVIGAGKARLAADAPAALQLGGLAFTGLGTLDVGEKALVVKAGGAAEVPILVAARRMAQLVTTSSNPLFGVGAMLNENGQGQPRYTTWNGLDALTAVDVLVLGTWMGDANLDGTVNALDYTLMDAARPATWAAGDFNGDGVLDAVDYAWIDVSAQQLGQLTPDLQNLHVTLFGPAYSDAVAAIQAAAGIPEPATAGLLGLAASTLFLRRRRR